MKYKTLNPIDKEVIEFTVSFFEHRFPDKDISFEMKCGYFWEWVTRFKDSNPERFMDSTSLHVWKELK